MAYKKKKQDTQNQLYPGLWGNTKAVYLRDHHPKKYEFLIKNNLLKSHLDSIQSAYEIRSEELLERFKKKHGIDDELRESDSIEWLAECYKMEDKVRRFLIKKLQTKL